MKILLVHSAAIPVFAYGGTERVIWDLGKALIALGQDITYLVPGDSHCPFAPVLKLDESRPLLEQVPQGFDVVHFHLHPGDEPDYPHVVTEHGNTKKPRPFPRNTVFVSRNHAERYGAQAYVYNGLDWSEYAAFDPEARRSHFHFLGKGASPVKNLQGAIDVALQAGVELDVLGARRLNVSRQFRWTWSRQIHFHGMVGGAEKFRLLQQSRGLIFPVRWHEPFGLAVVESLYFGAPVFATPYGALPELVTPDIGHLTNDMNELVNAVQHQRHDPMACHRQAVDLFGHMPMGQRYLETYERVLSGEYLHTEYPVLPVNGRALLEWH